MNICVTGGSGFVGSKLVENLNSKGYQIKLLTRKSRSDNKNLFFISDLTNQKLSLSDFLNSANLIFHCAGEINNEPLMRELHVKGTQKLLMEINHEITKTGNSLHFVQLSSCGSYGSPINANQRRVITEDSPCLPTGEYEVTKTLSDELVIEYGKKQPLFSYTILRPTCVIGETMPNNSLRSLVRIIKKGLFFYISTNKSIASYIHVDDVVDALVICGTDPRAKNQIFNISNDCELNQIIESIRKKSPAIKAPICIPELPIRLLASLTKPFQNTLTQSRIDALVSKTTYPVKKMYDVLGYKPKIAIDKFIVEMFFKEL